MRGVDIAVKTTPLQWRALSWPHPLYLPVVVCFVDVAIKRWRALALHSQQHTPVQFSYRPRVYPHPFQVEVPLDVSRGHSSKSILNDDLLHQ